ncbi:MAG: hypothetical protein O7A98_06340 [Acidobacteria bacterium]|nr:hypothetical protein [Acidobacteriota bacterium]MCZ6726960.1 hypothetical protein [Acidobacteriota bacterium]
MNSTYPFRPWVRSTCRSALLWGLGVVAILGGITYVLQQPGSVPAARAFGVLMFYGSLFWVTLAKVWWTAGGAAVSLADGFLAYQPLHTFSPRRIALEAILSCAPRPGTQALRLVHRGKRGKEREFFLNLGVVDGRNEFLDRLGTELENRGLRAVAEQRNAWRHPQWESW